MSIITKIGLWVYNIGFHNTIAFVNQQGETSTTDWV